MGIGRFTDEEAIFNEALGIERPADRSVFLEKTCGHDARLLNRIRALLNVQASQTSILERAANSLRLTLNTPVVMETLGTTIDRYRLLEKIGEGGMAVVYMAEQLRPVHRKVALKIIKLGMDTEQVIARFEAERQALALMDHPNIAQVFDGGCTETGRPYFVMELVRGVSITEYCDKNRLTTDERLELFIQVCNAVQHAHQKGIIHRDIKPSNVMVTLHDGRPVPKVIDFGIAKAINQRLTEQTLFTRYSQIIGTPEYMSPEQAEMSGLDIDTRTDIYSLGVLLYELITGTTPLASETLRSAGYAEMQRLIREGDVIKPSTKIRALGETLGDVAGARRVSPEGLSRIVKGDLDWIVMKTLEKDRTRRYETAHGLAEDIGRHLRHEPTLAGSPSTLIRMQKFVRRHRLHLIAAAAAAAVIIGLAFSGLAYTRLAIQRTRTHHERTIAIVEDLLSGGEYERALSEVTPILRSPFVGPRARLLSARVLYELRGPEAGADPLRDLLTESPEVAANAHLLLAWIYLETAPNDPRAKEKAESHLHQGELLMPKTADAYLLRAITAQTVSAKMECLDKALELDPGHYGTHKARALAYRALAQYRQMETEASIMIGSQPKNPVGYMIRAMARRDMGLRENDRDLLGAAIRDHHQAAGLMVPQDRRWLDLYRQRRLTFSRVGMLQEALADTEACLRLEPEDKTHKFYLFCLLTGLGQYDQAQARYDQLFGAVSHSAGQAGPESELDATAMAIAQDLQQFDCMVARYVFDSRAAGQPWYPGASAPQGAAFATMRRADEQYRQLAAAGRRVVAEGFHPSWSPDGTELAYSRGVLGSSGVEILDLRTGKTRLLTVPGKDPAWSPDGKTIAYVRDRQVLSFEDLATDRPGQHPPIEQEEVWIIRADGSEPPRFIASGGWPNWGRRSNRLYYHCRTDKKMYSVSIEPGQPYPREILTCNYQFPVISPDERYIAYMQDDMSIAVKDRSIASPVAVWPGPPEKQHVFLNWSPDGQQVLIGCYWGQGLWTYDVTRNEASRRIEGFYGWSDQPKAGGTALALDRCYGQWHHEIWIIEKPIRQETSHEEVDQ
jgi:serine/threonine protein kinase/tetratricopeptide (TPR) repeat protein